jgi:predicted Rossmann fold flavoprotein
MVPDLIYDVIVIGGGPAGMMAAATAAGRGRKVVLLEKNPVVGKKLAITGGGRCNVTNNRPDSRDLAVAYGEASKFLHSLFSRYGVSETIEYFVSRGVTLVEENEGRMFPSTHKAATIVAVLVDDCQRSGVVMGTGVTVESIKKIEDIFVVESTQGVYRAPSCIVATGGTARPETGSNGEGFLWLRDLGHTIIPASQALVPVLSDDGWVSALAGVTLTDAIMTIRLDGKRIYKEQGKLLFTHQGLSGPGILNLSQKIGVLLPMGTVTVGVQLIPVVEEIEARRRLQESLTEHSNQKIKNVLSHLVPPAFVPSLLALSGLSGDVSAHSVRKEDRLKLSALLYELPVTIRGLMGAEKAVASGGGVALTEVDFRTMESKLIRKLFLVGDVLNINRPSGGYSLQLCWSSGAVAGLIA